MQKKKKRQQRPHEILFGKYETHTNKGPTKCYPCKYEAPSDSPTVCLYTKCFISYFVNST